MVCWADLVTASVARYLAEARAARHLGEQVKARHSTVRALHPVLARETRLSLALFVIVASNPSA